METHPNTHLEFLLTTLDNLNDAILVVDHAGTVLYTNQRFDLLFKPLVGDIVELIADFHEAGIQISNRPEGGARVELRFPKYRGTDTVS